jgi:hypothetical protein
LKRAAAKFRKIEGYIPFIGLLNPKNEASIVNTSLVLAISYIVALAVVYLYFDMPKVQEGKWNKGVILERI